MLGPIAVPPCLCSCDTACTAVPFFRHINNALRNVRPPHNSPHLSPLLQPLCDPPPIRSTSTLRSRMCLTDQPEPPRPRAGRGPMLSPAEPRAPPATSARIRRQWRWRRNRCEGGHQRVGGVSQGNALAVQRRGVGRGRDDPRGSQGHSAGDPTDSPSVQSCSP